jgi:ribonuclease HI
LNIKENYIGIGIVARDHNGDFMGARAITKLAMGALKVAEAMAALEAVLFCKEVGFFDVILKRDAKQIMDEVNAAGPNLSIAGQFVEGIQAEIHGLRQALMVHVGRDSNKVAPALSKKLLLRLKIWHG